MLHCDNMSIVHALNKQTSKEKKVMGVIRSMVLFALFRDIRFYAEHIPGEDNITADKLSRFQITADEMWQEGFSPIPMEVSHMWKP